MRIALAANLASGGGLDPEPLVEALRRHGPEVELFGCESDEIDRLVDSAPDRVAVAGGDGTIGPAAAAAGRLGVPLALIPTGTANDFARANELPDDLEEAAELAATGTSLRPLELGRRADRAVAAGDRDAVRPGRRDRLQLVRLAAEQLDLGAVGVHRLDQRLRVEATPGGGVGGERDVHRA